MQMTNVVESGLLHAFVMDGRGGARGLAPEDLEGLCLEEGESLWLHWDRGHVQAQRWLRTASGLSVFSCDLLLEDATRPRVLTLDNEQLLLFLRGVNFNPGAEPEDMVSARFFADSRRLVSLRLRPLHATDEMIAAWARSEGPKTPSEALLYLAESMTEKLEAPLTQLAEQLDELEECAEADERHLPEHGSLLQIRRRAAALRRFLTPQRDLFATLSRSRLSWFVADDTVYWNELNNRLIRYLEELESIRERVALLLEAEQQRRSEHVGRTLYRLAIITGLFLPLSFLAGLLGVNVGGMPGIESPYGFLLVCLLMALVLAIEWWWFRRLRWL